MSDILLEVFVRERTSPTDFLVDGVKGIRYNFQIPNSEIRIAYFDDDEEDL